MKKNKLLATSMASLMITGMLSGCDDTFDPDKNIPQDLYASPPIEDRELESNTTQDSYNLPTPSMSSSLSENSMEDNENSDESLTSTEENINE